MRFFRWTSVIVAASMLLGGLATGATSKFLLRPEPAPAAADEREAVSCPNREEIDRHDHRLMKQQAQINKLRSDLEKVMRLVDEHPSLRKGLEE